MSPEPGPDEDDVASRRSAQLTPVDHNLRLIAQNMSDVLFLYDGDRRIQFATASFESVTGYTLEELYARNFIPYMHPEDAPRILALWDRLFAGQPIEQAEFRIITRAGAVKWMMCHWHPILGEDGAIQYVIGRDVDITHLKGQEEELRGSKHLVERITSAIPDILYVYDLTEQRNTFINHEITSVLGYTLEQITAMGGDMLTRTMHPEDLQWMAEHQLRYFSASDDDVLEVEFRMQHIDGSWRWLFSRELIFMRSAAGIPLQVLGIAQDVTERKRLQQAEQARQQAEYRRQRERELDGMKVQLMRRISHEFRTPLSVIQAASEILDRYLDRLTTERRHEHITHIQNQIRHLTYILDEISLILDTEPLQLAAVNLETICRLQIAQMDVDRHIDLIIAPDLPEIQADAEKVASVLRHVLLNAARFSPEDAPIRVQLMPLHAGLVITVMDRGIGIPPAEQENIFEPFYRAANA